MPNTNPLTPHLQRYPFIVLDGALATELEARGCQLGDSLWSANLLIQQPEIIRQVHLDYFNQGAQCAITASYQASLPGFQSRGLSEAESLALIARSVELAKQARCLYRQQNPQLAGDPLPLIAGSIGPYGAYLADGSEYRGDYHCSPEQYIAFHQPRIVALISAGADLLACETQPSFAEIRALVSLLASYPHISAWFSFTLRDADHLSDGTPLTAVIDFLNQQPQVIAVGINCLAMTDTTAALQGLQRLTQLPLVVYPNSGEQYDALEKVWHTAGTTCAKLDDYLDEWLAAGARLIGGCCRTSPQDIHALAKKQRPIAS